MAEPTIGSSEFDRILAKDSTRLSNKNFALLLVRIMDGVAVDVTPDLIRHCRTRCTFGVRQNQLLTEIGARITDDERDDAELYQKFLEFSKDTNGQP